MAIVGDKKLTSTGGGVNAVDGVDGSDLTDGDFIFQMTTPGLDCFSVYVVDDDGAAAETSPDIIVPDANPGNINLKLMRNIPVPFSLSIATTGSQSVDQFPDTLSKSAHWSYTVSNGTHFRTGLVMGVWDAAGTSVQYNDMSSPDIGVTTAVELSVINTSSTVHLQVAAATTGWLIEGLRIRI